MKIYIYILYIIIYTYIILTFEDLLKYIEMLPGIELAWIWLLHPLLLYLVIGLLISILSFYLIQCQ